MTAATDAALLVALAAPALATVAVVAEGARPRPRPRRPGRRLARGRLPADRARALAVVLQGGGTAGALAWGYLLAVGAQGRTAVFHVSPLVAAGGCGAAMALVAAVDRVAGRRALVGAGLALTAAGVALAGGGAVQAAAVVGGLAAAAAAAIDASPAAERPPPALLALAGIGSAIAGFLLLHARAHRWSLPASGVVPRSVVFALLAAAAALAAAGAFRSRRPTAVLLAPALALGLAAAALRPGGDDLAAAVVVLGSAAVLAAGVRRGPLALALVGLAAAAAPLPLTPSSRLLAAAAVVAAVVDRPWACLAAVPGGVSLVAGVVDDGGRLALALGVAAGAVALLMAAAGTEGRAPVSPTEPGPAAPSPATLPAVAVGAWLVVAPGSWTWTGTRGGAYDRGVAVAVAAGLIAVVAERLRTRPGWQRGGRRHPPGPGSAGRQLLPFGRSASKPRPRRAVFPERARPRARPRAPAAPRGRRRRR